MSDIRFSEFDLMPELQQAIDALGFETATDIQAESIPLIRSGCDVIGRSQTGTGKTFAFAIPAIERIDRTEENPTVQVLVLCPTRELAQQSCDEVKKLIRFTRNIWPADVYGGAPIERQINLLKRSNLVIGTPGRVMDHMRRGTLSIENVSMVVLDEADEMLSMGFREDIETILKDIPQAHQTILFSATMPDSILELTHQYQNDPKIIEINREQVTLDNIRQLTVDVPMGRKLDALILLLHAYDPKRTILFCNTKLMVDEVALHLNKNGFTCEAIHGDMNQSQRTRVMEGFKSARLPILVATDVAARGIDVKDVDYIINYDVPQNNEYYVHRIGRTGRAGKEGTAITLCSGRRQLFQLKDIAKETKSTVTAIEIPTVDEIRKHIDAKNTQMIRDRLLNGVSERHMALAEKLISEGFEPAMLAAAICDLAFAKDESALHDIIVEKKADEKTLYKKLILNIGRSKRVAPNHIVSAIAERAGIRGSLIGKIEIYDNQTSVGIPADLAEHIVHSLDNLKICGIPVLARLSGSKAAPSPAPKLRKAVKPPQENRGRFVDKKDDRHHDRRPTPRDKRQNHDRRKHHN